MILDTLGVGFLGTSTEVFQKAREYSKVRSSMSTLELKTKCAHAPFCEVYPEARPGTCVCVLLPYSSF